MVFCGFELVLEPGRMDIAAAAVQAFIGAVGVFVVFLYPTHIDTRL
ncbi:hypothetical protein V6Z11_D06G169500 [Gossypium hirsutum]